VLALAAPAFAQAKPTVVPIVTPNGSSLPFTVKDGVKEFRLVAEPVKREFAPGMTVNAWGYNGSTPGPTIDASVVSPWMPWTVDAYARCTCSAT